VEILTTAAGVKNCRVAKRSGQSNLVVSSLAKTLLEILNIFEGMVQKKITNGGVLIWPTKSIYENSFFCQTLNSLIIKISNQI
jgi:hypothetical protein